jgi:gas vesicle protein
MSRDSGSNVVFLLLGGVIGAAAGLLFAPKSGKETREQLSDWLDERRERGTELLHKIKDAVPEKKEALLAAVKGAKQAFTERGHHAEKETVNA